MAGFVLDGVNDLIKQLEKLGDIDDVSFQMVDEAAEIMDNELKKAIRVNTQKYGTGTLAESIDHLKPRRNSYGIFTASTAIGKDTKRGKYRKISHASFNKQTGAYVGQRESYGAGAVRNQDKLYWLEYGNSHQEARPIIRKCINSAEEKVLEKMQEVFNREVKK